MAIQLSHKSLARSRKFSTTVTAREGQCMGTNFFHTVQFFQALQTVSLYLSHSKARLTWGPSLVRLMCNINICVNSSKRQKYRTYDKNTCDTNCSNLENQANSVWFHRFRNGNDSVVFLSFTKMDGSFGSGYFSQNFQSL